MSTEQRSEPDPYTPDESAQFDAEVPRGATCQRCDGRIVKYPGQPFWTSEGCTCDYPLVEDDLLTPDVYTPDERKRIDAMVAAGTLQSTCPNCGHFWLRDYSVPIRRCMSCGTIKPWADPARA